MTASRKIRPINRSHSPESSSWQHVGVRKHRAFCQRQLRFLFIFILSLCLWISLQLPKFWITITAFRLKHVQFLDGRPSAGGLTIYSNQPLQPTGPTQPSIPRGIGKLGPVSARMPLRLTLVWFIPFVDKIWVKIKQWDPLTIRAIRARFCTGLSSQRGTASRLCYL